MTKDTTFTTIRSEGGLLPTDLLARVREAGSGLPGTAPEDYHLAPGEKLGEAITRSWNRLTGTWRRCKVHGASGDNGRNGVFVDHLRHGIAQQDDVLVKGFNLPLQLDAIDEVNRHWHMFTAQ